MRIAFLCKRRYMSKDVVLDRYARLYEIPRQLALLGHQVLGLCWDYQGREDGEWAHEAKPGELHWRSQALRGKGLLIRVNYAKQVLDSLRAFKPDIIIAASDIPHIALGAWLARKLQCPYVADLYDNFEGFVQARIPGFVQALRWGIRQADLVTATSEVLRQHVLTDCKPKGMVLAMPSSVDLAVFHAQSKKACREALGLPEDAKLIGTAGGLYREKGIEPLFEAWPHIAAKRPDVHLVLAGPTEAQLPPPQGDRVHYLGMLSHAQVATLFNALDVGVISVLDTPFGRHCFPQKAYEMLACELPVVASNVGATGGLFSSYPDLLFKPGNAEDLARAVLVQLTLGNRPQLPIQDWTELIKDMEQHLPAPQGRNTQSGMDHLRQAP
ncbi:glycosyltransferase family 4 protein [Comamonas piscis]|uniref:Glycosyltransferase family 4 protein n=1 Tax=Comamonas piscis TaxID=1562974 RepID=A0A7G5EDE0_9BURK|nr:glycosyltransferase family 4 protein [Comamonas piscis]QMV72015.1 glycosyltransferase family 4 protein [Comamonas piscis]WSO34760.1 glycosyltransferase family 4 protein [Comamonas piscis]